MKIFLFAFTVLLTSCGSNLCDEKEKNVFCQELKAKVIQKYVNDEMGRPVYYIRILNENDSIFNVANYSQYDSCPFSSSSVAKPELG